jgi:hypothetical protein
VDARAVVALIEEEAGLLAVHHVDEEPHAVLDDLDRHRRLFAEQQAARTCETFLGPHSALAALQHAARRQQRAERLHDERQQARRARGQRLADEELAVAVDDDPRQTVALPVHHAVGDERRR